MREYRFDCLDGDGRVTQSHTTRVACDDDAREIAKRLLSETHCDVLEVWREANLIHRSAKPA